MLGMTRQTGVEDLLHLLVLREIIRYLPPVGIVLFHAYRQRLDAAQDQPTLKRRQDRACSFLQESKLLRLFSFGAYNHAAEAVTVSVQEFGCRMDHHVGAKLNR